MKKQNLGKITQIVSVVIDVQFVGHPQPLQRPKN